MSNKYSRIMTTITQKCNQCSATFEVPEDYAAPFVKCPECGSMQRNQKSSLQNEPKYKLSNKSGELGAVKMPIKVVDDSKMYEDIMGVDGLNKLYQEVALYMVERNIVKRRSTKNKLIQSLMRKYSITSDVSSHMVDFAEKSEKTQEIMASKNRNSKLIMVIIGVFVVATIIGIVLAFL